MTAVVQAALSCVHGNATVESGFSESGNTLTDARPQMLERTLSATQTVKSVLKLFGNNPANVPISGELMAMARGAYHRYEEHLRKE